ncbi:low-density lipoprotein receptor-related protein 6, partial [Rhipicephalus sanguineus]|uniref:low-density lipoprotein receptor-related protein 6 n=1 Tax=Rhipicephalus sanguineus TaxID=34632 RepID=UPI001892E8BF
MNNIFFPGWNQCAVYNGGCSHLCLGVPGLRGFQCACPTHHLLGPNNRTCQRFPQDSFAKVKLVPTRFLLFSQKSSISRLGLNADDSPDIMLPIQGLKNIRALEFDPVADFLYWIDGKSHVIRRSRDMEPRWLLEESTSKEYGSHDKLLMQALLLVVLSHVIKQCLQRAQQNHKVTTVAVGTGTHPFALALDPYARQLFWSCSQGNLINISSLDGGRPLGILLASGEDRPRHLALHPHLG